MNKIVIGLLLLLPAFLFSQVKEKELAGNFIQLLFANRVSEAYQLFDSTVKSKITEEQLGTIMPGIEKQFGKFISGIDTVINPSVNDSTRRADGENELTTFDFGCKFENGSLSFKIVVNNKQEISGFWITPKTDKVEYRIPEYVNIAKFKELEVEFGLPEWRLKGTFTIPRRVEKPPVVILVHGSGPNDRDETIGPNKPFKDLAWGLASKGIAVLRYDKRTKLYGSKMKPADINIQPEVIDDVLEAVNFLKARDDIDKNKIIVLGHSLGAMVAPMIASQSQTICGIVMMAAPARKLEDLVLEQMKYIYSLKETISDDERNFLTDLQLNIDSLKNNTLPPSTPIIGIPASYFYNLGKYDQVKVAKGVKLPILILQGERDYQVTMEDFNIWRKKLSDHKNVKLKSYPKLNHLFMTGEGKAKPEEYNLPNSVEIEVIQDIVDWVREI
ncbi:MAG: alpha/beta fold hydrolase [Bacteroidota bacterium]|nr:alpha/beta fold hydrolase [Bacteroidota bacterium]